jgi:hypothetical protein
MSEQRKSPTAEQIIESGRQRRIKEVSYLGGVVFAHGLTRTEARLYRRAGQDAAGEGGEDAYSDERLVQHCIRDAAGVRIFQDRHLTLLADMNEADFRALLLPCLEVNGFGRIGEEALRKNSGTTGTSASGSGSPPTTASA